MKGLFARHRHVGRHRVALDDLLPELAASFSVTDRACCCPARPVVKVVLPRTASRPAPADLLLCGHHFRVSEAALRAARAVVYDRTGAVISVDQATGAGRAHPGTRPHASFTA